MTLPQGADYSLTENVTSPIQAEPTHIFFEVVRRKVPAGK
jgi:hypothetical protein